MGASDVRFEVVYVLRDFHLPDAASLRRTYARRDGRPLDPGYYVVSWPAGRKARDFRVETVFHGPFMRRRDAVTNMKRLQELLGPCDRTPFRAAVAAPVAWAGNRAHRGRDAALAEE